MVDGHRTLTSRSYRPVWQIVILLALVQIPYAAFYIHQSSFVVEGQRYFCLLDDAMISMKYAANLAAGHGLVWNPGDYVEGYTNLLWTLGMAACHLVGLTPSHTCLLIQILGVPVVWACLVATLWLARACRLPALTASTAVVLVGTYHYLMLFSLSGMETALVTFLVTTALAATVKSLRESRGRAAPLVCLAVGLLVRPDVMWIVLVVGMVLLVRVRERRSAVLLGLGVVVLAAGGHMLWSRFYYGDWMPNTYYLKATGWPLLPRLQTGVLQSWRTGLSLGLPLLLGALACLARRRGWGFLLLAVALLAVAYEIYVGGDWMPYSRFVVPVVPALFVLASDGLTHLLSAFTRDRASSTGRLLHAGVVAAIMLVVNFFCWDHWLLISPPNMRAGNRELVQTAIAINRICDPDVAVALGAAGAIPYFAHGRYIDMLGRCEARIARLPVRDFPRRAGHNKRDVAYTLQTYRPDIVLHTMPTIDLFRQNYRPVAIEVDQDDVILFVRRDSSQIQVDESRYVDWRTAYETLIQCVIIKGGLAADA